MFENILPQKPHSIGVVSAFSVVCSVPDLTLVNVGLSVVCSNSCLRLSDVDGAV